MPHPDRRAQLYILGVASASRLLAFAAPARQHEITMLALCLGSDEAACITGVDYPIDGGFFKRRG